MDCGSHIVQGSLQSQRGDRLSDNFGRQRPDRMDAKYLAVLFFRHHLDEAFMLAENRRFAIADEWKLTSLYLEACFARLLFCQAYGSDLRLAICGVGTAFAIERLHVFAGHAPNGDDSFHRSGVRKLR